jgi:ABC-type uncharacterized transport system substrate-binding protein
MENPQSLKGFVEGQNLAFDFLFLEGKTERLSAAMAELVRRKVDVIVAGGTEIAVTAALRATDTTPIVMVAIEFDPFHSAMSGASRDLAATSPGFSFATSS